MTHPIAAPTGGPTAVPPRSAAIRSAPSRQVIVRTLLVLAAGVAAVVGLALVDRLFDPASVATGYFGALADRDSDAALDRMQPGTETVGSLMSTSVLHDAGYTPPRDAHVEGVDVRGDTAVARVSFRLGDTRSVSDVGLVRSGHSFLLFQRWRIQSGGAYPLTVTAPAIDQVEIAGTAVAAGAPVAAFPGTYQAGLPDNPLLTAGPTAVQAGPEGQPIQLTPTIKSSALAGVGKQVRSYLDTCALSTELEPPDCPFSAFAGSDVTNVRWTITSYPRSTLEVVGSTVELTTSEPGTARVSADQQQFDGSTSTSSDDVSFTVAGQVTVQNGTVRWQPSS